MPPIISETLISLPNDYFSYKILTEELLPELKNKDHQLRVITKNTIFVIYTSIMIKSKNLSIVPGV